MKENIQVLFLREGRSTVAQCLEYNIAAQGEDVQIAKWRFARTILGQAALDRLRNKEPLAGIGEAPKMYWEMSQRGAHTETLSLLALYGLLSMNAARK